MSPPSFSGRSGGTGCDIQRSPPQYNGSNNGYGTDGVRSSSTDTALMVAWGTVRHSYSGTAAVVIVIVRNRSCDTTAAATVHHCSRSSSKPPLHFCSFGREQGAACRNGPPVNGGPANSIEQGQAQRDVGVNDQEEGQRPLMEVDCHAGPLF